MARTRAEMRAETMQKLIASARRSFAEMGYAQTSMDALCAEVGLTRGALYHHFGGKAGLLEAVVREIDHELNARLEEAWEAAEDPWKGYQACCMAFLEAALEPEIQRVYLRDASAVLGQRLRDIDAESSLLTMTEAMAELMKEGYIRPTDPEALSRLLSGAMIDAALWIASSDRPRETLLRAQSGLLSLLDGLAHR